MWIPWFILSWAMFMALLILTIVHEDRRDAQINRTLESILDAYPDPSEGTHRQSYGGAQPVSSTGVETEKVLSAG
jgi:hypothetical protein